MKNDNKDIVVGLGEIGTPILKLLSKSTIAVGFDKDPSLMDQKKFLKFKDYPTELLHVCIPYSNKFSKNVMSLIKKFNPQCVVVHSTISPYTTHEIQKKTSIPVMYSATRGVHKRMLSDMKKYTKFFAVYPNSTKSTWAKKIFSQRMKKSGIKTKSMSNPHTLELAKIVCDTSYYGWLINYAQISNLIAKKHLVNYDEMWTFADEIHKYLGNRPKMYPGYIGGHCVIPNLELINNETLNLINKLNNIYAKQMKFKTKKAKLNV